MVLAPCSLERTAPKASPVVELRQVDREDRHGQEDGEADPGEDAATRDKVGRSDVDPEVVVLEELSAENEVLEQKTEGQCDKGHVEIPHPDHEQAEEEAEGEGHETPHQHGHEYWPAVVDGQDGHRESTHPRQGGLAQPDHSAFASDKRVGQEDDAVADTLGDQAQPEPMHDEWHQAHRCQAQGRGPPTQGLASGNARCRVLVGGVWPDGSVKGATDPG